MDNIDLTLINGSGFSTIFEVKDSNEVMLPLSGYDITITFFDKDGVVLTHYDVTSAQLSLTAIDGEVQLILSEMEVDALKEGTYTLIINDGVVPITVALGNVFVTRLFTSNLEYLIPYLRLKIGDINPTTYRYANEWLLSALVLSVKVLQRYWDYKYLVDSTNVVSRNSASNKFRISSPPIIEAGDEYVIVLMAAIITLEGSLESSAWNTVSWSDAEIRYTNLDGGRIRESNLSRLLEELNSIIMPPTKRLAGVTKGSLPGYLNNDYEYKSD